jgi:hypothetical protein
VVPRIAELLPRRLQSDEDQRRKWQSAEKGWLVLAAFRAPDGVMSVNEGVATKVGRGCSVDWN